eukprot:scaffold67450_cov63-Phaeocystis_antarctica.AAC.2
MVRCTRPPLAQGDARTRERRKPGEDDARAWTHRAAPTHCRPRSRAHGPRRHGTGRRRCRPPEAHGGAAPPRQDRDAGET